MENSSELSALKSDDEDDFAPKKVFSNNYKSLLDSESEEDENKKENLVEKNLSDSEEDEIADKSLIKSRIVAQSSDSSDSDHEEAKESPEKPVKDRRKNQNPKKKIIEQKTQRKSATKAMEVIKDKMNHKKQAELNQEIQSEKQRMDREQDIRVPYHKPKQYSLKEFLARRTINKPSIEKIKEGQQPVSSIKALKMNQENLAKFVQKMKEREEEALEFFKSESESDDEESENLAAKITEEIPEIETLETVQENKSDEVEDKKMEIGEKVTEIEEKLVESEEKVAVTEEEASATEFMDTVESEKLEIVIEAENSPQTDNKLASVEETPSDPELDRLREKYKNTTVDIDESDVKPQISFPTLKTLDEMNSKDFVIDLETGSIQPRKLTGPEMLFQKYLKTVQKPKAKDTISMNILTVENGKLENTKVEVKLEKEVELDHERPGFSHEKLKENLRNQIANKRLEEIKKKMKKLVPKELEPEDKENFDGFNGVGDEESDGDFEGDDCGEQEEAEESCEEEEEEVEETKKKKKKVGSAFLDEEAIDEDESEDESDEELSSSSDDEPEEKEATAPKKGRILKAFEDSDDETVEKTHGIVKKSRENFDKSEEIVEKSEKTDKNVEETENNEISEVFPETVEEIETVSEPLFTTKDLGQSATQDDFDSPAISEPRTYEDIFSTQPSSFDEPSVSEREEGIEGICDAVPQEVDDDDLMEICSGRFAATQIGFTQNALKVAAADDGDGFHDSQFVSQVPEREVEVKIPSPQVENARKFLESTDDEADQPQVKEKRKKKKKRQQRVKKLGFSDDEDAEASNQMPENVEEEQEEENSDDPEEECEDEQEEVLVDYDSEENEIEVKMNKKDRIKAAGAYFEAEAELSESEWGSADEDEKNMDKFDIELGDEDNFDQTKLREEVGRIHAAKMLDDDIRNVKKIQELLFEDEETDGVGRDRKFRWKNQTEGFALEDENARDGDAADGGEGEDESEISWRKMRYERETLLSEQSQKMTESDTMSEDILLLDHNSQSVTSSSTSFLVKRKFQVVKVGNSQVTTPDAVKKDSPFLIKSSSRQKFQSSSFLSRDEQTLTKIARFMSQKDDEFSNTMSSHGGNSMSFATIDKPDDSKKRKSDGNQKPEVAKKRKVEAQPKAFLLDQLK